MDFGRTQLTGLMSSVQHEKSRYLGLLQKIKLLISINKEKKLINTSVDRLVFTSSPKDIYANINYQHPVVRILSDYITKLDLCAEGPMYFLALVDAFVDDICFLLENGISPKEISRVFTEAAFSIKCDAPPMTEAEKPTVEELSDDTKAFIRRIVSNQRVAGLLIDAISTTKSFDPEIIRVAKVASGVLEDSYRMDGLVIIRRPEGTITSLKETSVGIFNCPLDINRTELKGTVLFQRHDELLNFTNDEVQRIKQIVDSLNVNIIVVCGGVDDTFLEFANKRNILVLRVFNKFDLKRLCDAVGGTICNSIGPIRNPGWASEVSLFKDGALEMTRVVGGPKISTIVLKHTLKPVLDEVEREILACLQALNKSGILEYVSNGFHTELILKIGRKGPVREAISKSLERTKPREIIVGDAYRSVRNALEMVGLLLDINDYLVAKRDMLDIKPPQHAGHWDEDH